jgi:hypothetical protein
MAWDIGGCLGTGPGMRGVGVKLELLSLSSSGSLASHEPQATAMGVLGLSLTPSRGCARVYPMGIALEPPGDLWDRSGGSPVDFLFPGDLTYHYV